MTDKERILMMIITRIIPGLSCGLRYNDGEYIKSCMFAKNKLQNGDLVFANTTISPNKYMVGFVHEVKDDCVVIREIGTQNLCNYYNESFTKINKEKLGYNCLEGIQYKIYEKVLKAFEYTSYCTRFKSISFDENMCIVQARRAFENDLYFEVSFPYNSKTTIKSIGKILEEKEKNVEESRKN